MGFFVRGGRNRMHVLSMVAEVAWDVLFRLAEMAWDVLSGLANLYGMFCLGWQKMALMFCHKMFFPKFVKFKIELLCLKK